MNIELLKKIDALWAQFPERHDQSVVLNVGPCGMQGCLAGEALLFAGRAEINLVPGGDYTSLTMDGVRSPMSFEIIDAAAEVLDIDRGLMSRLYTGENDQVRKWVSESIASGVPQEFNDHDNYPCRESCCDDGDDDL